MKNIIFAQLENSSIRLINEDQVCTVEPGNPIKDGDSKVAVVRMSNGDILRVIDPNWDQWENDLFLPR